MWGCLGYQRALGLSLCKIRYSASALTAQKAFLNNFEDIVNHRVDIWEDIRRYQDTLSYTSSKVDYSMGENIYMLPSDINLNIRSGIVGYNNKILVSDVKFSLGKNDKVNALETPAMKSTAGYNNKILVSDSKNHKVIAHSTTTQDLAQKQAITHKEERAALVLFLTGGFTI